MKCTSKQERKRILQRIKQSRESIKKVTLKLNKIRQYQLYEHLDCIIKIRQLRFKYAEASDLPTTSDHSLWHQEVQKTRLEELARSINLLEDTIGMNTINNYLQETKYQNVITCLEQNIKENEALLVQDYIKVKIKEETE